MKKNILLLTAFSILFFSCTKNSSNTTQNDLALEEIESIANDFFISLGTGDTTLMRTLLATDFEMFEHDELWNIDSLLSLMPNTLGRKWSIEDLEVSQNDGLVHLYYFNNSINPTGRSWYESMLLNKNGDELKIRFMHSTKLYLK